MSNLAIAQPTSSIENARSSAVKRAPSKWPQLTSVPMAADSQSESAVVIAANSPVAAQVTSEHGAAVPNALPVALAPQHAGPLRVANTPARSVYEPLATVVEAPARPKFQLSTELEAQLITIIDAPIDGSAATGFALKEQQLGAAFAALSLQQSRELLRRLKANTLDNPVATADVLRARFATFVVERRNRLLAFLADAPRRAAIASR